MPVLRFPEFRDTREWKLLHGDKVFDQISNKDHNSDLPILAITQEYGAIPREEINYNVSVTDKSIESYKVVEAGDFIISLRSFQGGIEYSNYKGLCSPAYVILRKKIDVSNHFYKQLFKTNIFIQSMSKNIEGIRDGKMVSYKQFSELLLPYPLPDEQQKIADFLISVDELITFQTQKLDALKTHKKGLMQQLFPDEGETVPKRRFPGFRGKGEWATACLGVIASIKSGSTPLRSNSKFHDGGDIPWVKTTDLNNSFICSTEECITSLSNPRINPEETVLVAMYGGFNQIGRTGFLKIPAATNQALSALNTDRSKVLPFYLLMWLNAKVEDWKKIASSSRKDPNITGSDVADFPIKFPCVEEQQKIADCLNSIDELISNQVKKVEALKAHKKGLVQQLFPTMNEVGV